MVSNDKYILKVYRNIEKKKKCLGIYSLEKIDVIFNCTMNEYVNN